MSSPSSRRGDVSTSSSVKAHWCSSGTISTRKFVGSQTSLTATRSRAPRLRLEVQKRTPSRTAARSLPEHPLLSSAARPSTNQSQKKSPGFLAFVVTVRKTTTSTFSSLEEGRPASPRAFYAAAEGLSALVVEDIAIGGQAGASSRIKNYLGFPTGISGADLVWRVEVQALKFGTQFATPRRWRVWTGLPMEPSAARSMTDEECVPGRSWLRRALSIDGCRSKGWPDSRGPEFTMPRLKARPDIARLPRRASLVEETRPDRPPRF